MVTQSTATCLVKGWVEFLANPELHSAHGHYQKESRHEPSSSFFSSIECTKKTFSKGNRVVIAQPRTGEAQRISEETLLEARQVLSEGLQVEPETMQPNSDAQPEPPVVPPTKEPETPELNWVGVPTTLIARSAAFWISMSG